MTKAELIERVAKQAGLTKADSERAINAFTDSVVRCLKKKDRISLTGFGTFSARRRKARTGRNPQTGAEIKIAACNVAHFSAGKGFKDALN